MTATLLTLTGSVPLFETTDVIAAVAPSSMSCDPNESVPGEGVSCVRMPVPSSATEMSAAFECTVAVPVRAPVVVGSKAIRSLQVSPAASVVEEEQSSRAPVD